MEMQISIRLGEAMSITVRSDDQRELIEAAAFFQELPRACPVCKAPVVFTARHPQSYNYYGLRCTGRPSHESTFGVKKEGGSLFYKASEPWTAWQPGARPESESEPDVEPEIPRRAASPAERGPAERGPAERGPAERGPAERGPAERGPAERGPARSRQVNPAYSKEPGGPRSVRI